MIGGKQGSQKSIQMLNFTLYHVTERYWTPAFDFAAQGNWTSSPMTVRISCRTPSATAANKTPHVNLDQSLRENIRRNTGGVLPKVTRHTMNSEKYCMVLDILVGVETLSTWFIYSACFWGSWKIPHATALH